MYADISKKLRMMLSYKDLIIFLIPFIIFMVYLYVYNPGIARFDSFTQLHQIATGNFDNWHPFFHTFIEMVCLKIYPDTKAIAFLQIMVFSIIWMIICSYFRNDNLENGIDKEFIFQAIFTLIICLIPINPLSAITFLKDTLFSYFLLFACFLIKVILDKKGDVSLFFIAIFSLNLAFLAQVRHNGTVLVLVFLLIFCAYLIYEYGNRKLPISIVSLTVLFIILILTLNVVYDVEDNDKDAVMAKVMHMLVDYELNITMDDSDKASIGKVIKNYTRSEQVYDITLLDPITGLSDPDAYNENKLEILGIAMKYSIKHPIHFLQYAFHSAPMVWHIAQEQDWHGHSYGTSTDGANKRFYNNTQPVTTFDNITSKNSQTKMYNDLDSIVNEARLNSVLDTLFNKPAFYMYLSFVLMGAIYLLSRSKDVFLVYLPNFLNIAIIFASTPAQHYRYLYPNLLVFYLLVIMFISIIAKRKSSSNHISSSQ